MDAVTYVQEKEDCTVKNAAEQLIIAIVDGALAACWDDVLGLEAAAPSDFSGVVKICLYDIGFVERIKVPEELESIRRRTRDNYPTLKIESGPVLGAVCDVNRFLDDAAPAYVALLVLKEHMDLWPLGDSRIGSGKTRKQDYARPKTSEAVILREAQRLYRESFRSSKPRRSRAIHPRKTSRSQTKANHTYLKETGVSTALIRETAQKIIPGHSANQQNMCCNSVAVLICRKHLAKTARPSHAGLVCSR